MTKERCESAFSRHDGARVDVELTLSKLRGRREGRGSTDPMARVHQKKHAAVTTGSAGYPDLPCAMALRLIRTLPGDRAFLPPSLATFVTPASLASASGGQDHTISPSAAAPFVHTIHRARRCRGHRIPSHVS